MQQQYPEKESWSITGGTAINVSKGIFETPIGRTAASAETQATSEATASQDDTIIQEFYEQVECWQFNVHRNGSTLVEQGVVIVNPEGKMMCQGKFEGVPTSDVYYRIR